MISPFPKEFLNPSFKWAIILKIRLDYMSGENRPGHGHLIGFLY